MPAARATRPYYVLAANEGSHIASNPWGVAFGDYDKETVKSERDDYRNNGWKARELKIIKCSSAKQATVDAEIAKLNTAAE